MGITGRSENFEHAFLDGQKGDIKGTTAQIINNDLSLGTRLVQTVRDGGCRGFVDDSEYVQASDSTGVFCGLSLSVVEAVDHTRTNQSRVLSIHETGSNLHSLGGDSDYCVCDLLTEVSLCDLLHFTEHHR